MAAAFRLQSFFRTSYDSAMLWSWAYSGLRIASGFLLLPLLLRALSPEELGIYYIFLRITALLPIIDFGFSATVNRFVSYAMGGATQLRAYGVTPTSSDGLPNKPLLWTLLLTYRNLYRWMALITLLLLGGTGTYNIALHAHETTSASQTWWAWVLTLIAAVFEIYAGWWSLFLRGMDQVVSAARFSVLGCAIQMALAISALLLGGGLLSIPLASLFGSFVQRYLSRRNCLTALGPPPRDQTKPKVDLLRVFWPNTWRAGLQFFSTYLGNSIPALIFAGLAGSGNFAEYGLSLQIISFCIGLASVWSLVRWPMVSQLQARRDHQTLRRLLRPVVWLQGTTFIVLAGSMIYFAPPLLHLLGSKKQTLPSVWFAVLALNGFLELRFSFWTTLLSTENRIPSLWPTVATNILSLALFLGFLRWTSLRVEALVLAPLISGLLFNYWYWPLIGARRIGTKWLDFCFRKTVS